MEYVASGCLIQVNVIDMCIDTINFKLIRRQRENLGLSLADLSNCLGKSISTLKKYELGNVPTSWYVLKDICLYLSIPADILFGMQYLLDDEFYTHIITKNRCRMGLTIREFSLMLGKRDVSSYVYGGSGKVPKTWVTCKKLCRVLDISPNNLLGLSCDKQVEAIKKPK